jgi:hypothetical protein
VDSSYLLHLLQHSLVVLFTIPVDRTLLRKKIKIKIYTHIFLLIISFSSATVCFSQHLSPRSITLCLSLPLLQISVSLYCLFQFVIQLLLLLLLLFSAQFSSAAVFFSECVWSLGPLFLFFIFAFALPLFLLYYLLGVLSNRI